MKGHPGTMGHATTKEVDSVYVKGNATEVEVDSGQMTRLDENKKLDMDGEVGEMEMTMVMPRTVGVYDLADEHIYQSAE